VKLHAPNATDAERCEAVGVLQISERSFNSHASTVEVAEPLCVARDAREQTRNTANDLGTERVYLRPPGDRSARPLFRDRIPALACARDASISCRGSVCC
jgi:hypothetical protein